jgi:uncharacterized NAD-dependent epimerase/dehydratase family protein
MVKEPAVVLTNGWLDNIHAKAAHGLLRGSDRFEILALIDPVHAGKDAGEVMDGKPNHIPIFPTITESIHHLSIKPVYCLVGVTAQGGKLPDSLRTAIVESIRQGLSVVSGMHTYLTDDPEFKDLASKNNVQLIDIRKSRPIKEMRFWSGEIFSIKIPRIAVLGMDCAIGKRTTAKLLMEMCRKNGIDTQLIYTGQTGWLQGLKHGFILDAVINDFIGGEIERVIVECARESSPELMFVEGQSSLRNPSGPCGSELLLSGNIKGVILQHAPGRKLFEGLEKHGCRIPSLEEEIQLIRIFGAKTLAVTLNEEGMHHQDMMKYQKRMEAELKIPVVRPLKESPQKVLPVIREFMENNGE